MLTTSRLINSFFITLSYQRLLLSTLVEGWSLKILGLLIRNAISKTAYLWKGWKFPPTESQKFQISHNLWDKCLQTLRCFLCSQANLIYQYAGILVLFLPPSFGIAEWLDHSTLLQKVPGSKPPSRCHKVREEDLPALCSFWQKGKWNHEVWSHREEGPGLHCTALISLPTQLGICVFCINKYLTKIVSVFVYQLSMHCFH